jgi:hypothetical protein
VLLGKGEGTIECLLIPRQKDVHQNVFYDGLILGLRLKRETDLVLIGREHLTIREHFEINF